MLPDGSESARARLGGALALGFLLCLGACSSVSTVNKAPEQTGGSAGAGGAGKGGSAGSSVDGGSHSGGSAQGGSAGSASGGDAGSPMGGSAGSSGNSGSGGSSGSGGDAGAGNGGSSGSGAGGASGALPSAEWYRQFGTSSNESARGVRRAPNGDVVLVGYIPGALPGQIHYGQTDVFLRRYDAEGSELWTRQFGTSASEYPTALAIDQAGDSYFAAGPAGATTIYKYAADGSKGWTSDMGGHPTNRVMALAVDASNNLFVVGRTSGNLGGFTQLGYGDAFIWKYAATGEDLWIHQFGTVQGDQIEDIEVDPAGNIYLAGSTSGKFPGETQDGTGNNVFVAKFNTSGGLMWLHQFAALATCVAHDGQGGLYVAGYLDGTLPGQAQVGLNDAFVRRYDSTGAESWTLQFGTTNLDYVYDCALGSDGNLRAVGRSYDESAPGAPPVVWTLSPTGALLDTRFLSVTMGEAEDIALAADWMFVSGNTSGTLPGQSTSGASDVFLAALKQ